MTAAASQGGNLSGIGPPLVDAYGFLKPTLTGIGLALAVILTLTLVILAGLLPGGGGNADATANTGQSDQGGVGVVTSNDEGSGNSDSNEEEDSVDEPSAAPVEITGNTSTPTEVPPVQANSNRRRTKPFRKASLAPFTIASLPSVADGNEQGSQRGGSGFSDIEERLDRAGAKSGDVQISLAWNNFNDLDLHVVTPGGETIMFSKKRSSCLGNLDVDMNAGGLPSNKPVENVFWPIGLAPKGEFIVIVHHYANHGGADPTRYQVIAKVDGSTRTFSGSVRSGDRREIVNRFTRR